MSKAAPSFKIALQPKSGAMSAASSAVNTAFSQLQGSLEDAQPTVVIIHILEARLQ